MSTESEQEAGKGDQMTDEDVCVMCCESTFEVVTRCQFNCRNSNHSLPCFLFSSFIYNSYY